MAKPQFPVGREYVPKTNAINMDKFAEARINAGMITTIDPADIPGGAMQLVRNARVRFDKTSRRAGGALFTPAKPNSNPVMKFASVKTQDGTPYTLRFTPSTLHKIDSPTTWAVIAGTMAGTVLDRFNTAVVFNHLVFANNGVDYIQVVDPTFATFDRLGNAPKYRYICGFYNRVVGFALRDENEVMVGWSADAGILGDGLEEWDPLVDETSGSTPLIESTSDLSDFITGGFAWTNVMLIPREKSIWIGTKQPIPQQPFSFQAVVPGIGCDCPYSLANIGDGIAWFDRRTAAVYAYALGGGLEAIGRSVENEIARTVDDPEEVFASYDPIPNEYTIYIPQSGLVIGWTYNRRGKTWAKNEYQSLTSVDDVETIGFGGLTIDQLVGTIDELPGTIDELTSTTTLANLTRIYGYVSGDAGVEDVNVDVDANGYVYTTELVSKVFTIPQDDIYVAEIRIEYEAHIGGSFRLDYSRTGGMGSDPWRTAKTVTPSALNEARILKYRRMIRCRRFAFRIVSTQGLFDTLAYEVHVYKAGQSNK